MDEALKPTNDYVFKRIFGKKDYKLCKKYNK